MANRRVIWTAAVLAACSSAVGCFGEVQPAQEPAEDASIRAYLAGRGYDPRHVRFEGDLVFVEQDAFTTRTDLLAEMALGSAGSDDLVEKGYWRTGGSVPYAKRIGFAFDDNVPQFLRNAVGAAGVEWSQPTSCVKMSQYFNDPDTHMVRVTYEPLRDGVGGQASIGFGRCPPDITPDQVRGCSAAGAVVRFNSKYWGPYTTNYDFAVATSIHELGHTLGFMHPFVSETGKIHITGTGRANPDCDGSHQFCTVRYKSVMDYNENGGELHLTADDAKSLQKIYHPSRPSCQLP